jgi:hypothetical protein
MLIQIKKMWQTSPPLTFAALLMLAAFACFVPGIWLDSRIITGASAWLKPAKFALSSFLYCGTLAWMFRYIRIRPRTTGIAGWITAAVIILEVAIIAVQAARGTSSHFNFSTPFDAALWMTMGISIAILWLAGLAIAVALFQQPFEERAWGWALRLSMAITLLGSASGGFMTRPTHTQMAAINRHQPVPSIGAHTVGAPDGGPGLPVTDWSRDHGDLRVPHFFGLHAIQLLPLFCWLIARRRPALVFTAAASYTALLIILIWQALRGQSIAQPDSETVRVFGIWLLATILAVTASLTHRPGAKIAVNSL